MVQVKERGGGGNELLSNSTTASNRETWAPFLESPPTFAGPGLPKTRGPEKKKKTRRTPNDYEVLVIWVRRLSESSFSSVCVGFLTLITKLRRHSAWAPVPDSGF